MGYECRFFVNSFSEYIRIKMMGNEKKLSRRFIRRIKLGDVVYEIGAGTGLYTTFIAKAVGDKGIVIAFEPELRSGERLKQNLELNGVRNVKVFNSALGNKNVKKKMLIDKHFLSGAHGFFDEGNDNSTQKFAREVKIVTGDAFISKQLLPIPNVLKIDVEGMEYEVMLGLIETLKNPVCRLLFCEVHFSILKNRGMAEVPKKIEKLLNSVGFCYIDWLDHSHILASK